MKTILLTMVVLCMFACKRDGTENTSIELINTPDKQKAHFQELMLVTQNTIPQAQLSDSLAFLVLPVQASCPACRKKTIDSIVKHQVDLKANHFIIISANGGRKTIRGFFRELNYELPNMPGKFFLDSNNVAYSTQLYRNKPTIYYTYDQKAYKKVAAIPSTVKDDLREFFSGHREN